MKITAQEKVWMEKGAAYAKAGFYLGKTLDEKWSTLSGGVTRSAMNREFLLDLPRDMEILEVGCNVGNQLALLRGMGFRNLHGIELSWHAVKMAIERRPRLDIIQGTAFDLPYLDGYFDLVFTTWVLTHIDPEDLPPVLDGIHRCARRYIWGCEPYRDSPVPVEPVRGREYLWRGDFKRLYLERFPDLSLVKAREYSWDLPSRHPSRVEMFLLEKKE